MLFLRDKLSRNRIVVTVLLYFLCSKILSGFWIHFPTMKVLVALMKKIRPAGQCSRADLTLCYLLSSRLCLLSELIVSEKIKMVIWTFLMSSL